MTELILLTPQTAVKITGIGKNRMYNLFKTQSLPAFKLGRLYKIDYKLLLQWIDTQTKIH